MLPAFIGRNFTGTGPVPTRTAFAGRLPSTPDGDRRRFQFFYATNRDAADDATFHGRGSKLGTEISAGTFDVLISPCMPIVPWVWFDTKYMEWAGREALSQDEALARLRTAVQASPHKSVLVIVWGFRDWFQSAALKTAYTAYVLDINTPVLLFDWPGNQGEGTSGYRASVEVATKSAPDLGRVLARVTRETGAETSLVDGQQPGVPDDLRRLRLAGDAAETVRRPAEDRPCGAVGARTLRPMRSTTSSRPESRRCRST